VLYLSLIVSAALLVTANVLVARGKEPAGSVIAACLSFAILPICITFTLPTVMLQAALLSASLLLLLHKRRGRKLYVPVSLAVTLAAYGVTSWFAYSQVREIDRLRDRYQFASLEDRLPARPPTATAPPARTSSLWQLEQEIDVHAHNRNFRLRQLHEQKVDYFVNSFGFGESRMRSFPPTEGRLTVGLRDGSPIPQPGERTTPPDRPAGPLPPGSYRPAEGGDPDLAKLHDGGVLDFVNPNGFGLVKDRRHVAGFQSHAFSKVPGPAKEWALARLDLIGLVMHDAPTVYDSANLPRMDELRTAPTRPLDPFERESLATLQRGEDLVVRETGDRLRMLGAVRATKQCLDCHGGNRGDLLGAFSYVLRRGE
jgi:hypothetical protein